MKLVLALLLLTSFNLHSQDFIENDTLDIDGALTHKRPSASDRLKKLREKLEAKNEAMVRQKIEQLRVKQEVELMRKLQASFAENLNRIDKSLK